MRACLAEVTYCHDSATFEETFEAVADIDEGHIRT